MAIEDASPVWSNNGPYGFAAENLIDGNLDREQTHKSCYHTLQTGQRPADEQTPYVNLSMSATPVKWVKLLTRNVVAEAYGAKFRSKVKSSDLSLMW